MDIDNKGSKTDESKHGPDNSDNGQSDNSMSGVKHKLILVSSKPGVGKTVVSICLARALSKMDNKVGLVDINIDNPGIHKLLSLKYKKEPGLHSISDPVDYSDSLKIVPFAGRAKNEKSQGKHFDPSLSYIKQCISSVDWGQTEYVLFDTSSGPSEELRELIESVPDAKIIIVTAPNKIDQKSYGEMVDFFKKQKIKIWGWIENMRGYLCQNCDQRLSTMGTGPSGRAIFLNEIPFLGRIPVDINLNASSGKKTMLMEYPCLYDAEPYEMIAEKIISLIKKNNHKTER